MRKLEKVRMVKDFMLCSNRIYLDGECDSHNHGGPRKRGCGMPRMWRHRGW